MIVIFFIFYQSLVSAFEYKNKFSEEIEKIRVRNQLPGIAVVFAEHGKVVVEEAFGVRKINAHDLVTKSDKWHLGSCTKSLTAVLIAKLIDQKKLDWDFKIASLLSKDATLDREMAELTVQMLLGHRGGLKKDFDGELRSQIVRDIMATKPGYALNTEEAYSNSGFVVLGWAAEKVTGLSWEALVQQEIFKPLNMTGCGFGSPADKDKIFAPDQPWGHKIFTDAVKPAWEDNHKVLAPAGTIHCGMKDWYKFATVLQDGYLERSSFLKKASFTNLFSKPPHSASNRINTYFTLARVENSNTELQFFAANGSNTSNLARIMLFPKQDKILLIATNAVSQLENDPANKALTEIYKLLIPKN